MASVEQLATLLNFAVPAGMGYILSAILQGVIFVQILLYFQQWGSDKPFLKAAVLGLLVLTTLRTVLIVYNLFAILDGGGLQSARDRFILWNYVFEIFFVNVVGCYVQTFFIIRLQVISKTKWLSVVISVFLIGSFGANITLTYLVWNSGQGARFDPSLLQLFSVLWVSLSSAVDVLISSSTCFYLIRHRREMLTRMTNVLNSLIRLSFMSMVPATICSLVLVILFLVPPKYSMYSVLVAPILPKLQAISMMWNLLARKKIREDQSEVSPNISALTLRNNTMELPTISATKRFSSSSLHKPFDTPTITNTVPPSSGKRENITSEYPSTDTIA